MTKDSEIAGMSQIQEAPRQRLVPRGIRWSYRIGWFGVPGLPTGRFEGARTPALSSPGPGAGPAKAPPTSAAGASSSSVSLIILNCPSLHSKLHFQLIFSQKTDSFLKSFLLRGTFILPLRITTFAHPRCPTRGLTSTNRGSSFEAYVNNARGLPLGGAIWTNDL